MLSHAGAAANAIDVEHPNQVLTRLLRLHDVLPPHHHAHDELFLVRTGTVEFNLNGKPYRLGPGSVALAANNDEHGVRNVGAEPAQYFVVAIGKD